MQTRPAKLTLFNENTIFVILMDMIQILKLLLKPSLFITTMQIKLLIIEKSAKDGTTIKSANMMLVTPSNLDMSAADSVVMLPSFERIKLCISACSCSCSRCVGPCGSRCRISVTQSALCSLKHRGTIIQ